jgi:hypothetical protein
MRHGSYFNQGFLGQEAIDPHMQRYRLRKQEFSRVECFPAGAVAIAENGSGDCIVFLREGERFQPAPHLWHHATRALVKICGDFSAFGRNY